MNLLMREGRQSFDAIYSRMWQEIASPLRQFYLFH